MKSFIKPVNAAVRNIVSTIVEKIASTTDKPNTALTKQRAVSAALGQNITKDHAAIYCEIEKERFVTAFFS